MNRDNTTTPDGFNRMFESTLKEFSNLSQSKVYEITEQKHEQIYGQRRYSSVESFRKIRNKKRK